MFIPQSAKPESQYSQILQQLSIIDIYDTLVSIKYLSLNNFKYPIPHKLTVRLNKLSRLQLDTGRHKLAKALYTAKRSFLPHQLTYLYMKVHVLTFYSSLAVNTK